MRKREKILIEKWTICVLFVWHAADALLIYNFYGGACIART